jgi:hypothetical protein
MPFLLNNNQPRMTAAPDRRTKLTFYCYKTNQGINLSLSWFVNAGLGLASVVASKPARARPTVSASVPVWFAIPADSGATLAVPDRLLYVGPGWMVPFGSRRGQHPSDACR